jgi:hypothetical protein
MSQTDAVPEHTPEELREMKKVCAIIAWIMCSLRVKPDVPWTNRDVIDLYDVVEAVRIETKNTPIYTLIMKLLLFMIKNTPIPVDHQSLVFVRKVMKAYSDAVAERNQTLSQQLEDELTLVRKAMAANSGQYTEADLAQGELLLESVRWCTSQPGMIRVISKRKR